MSSPFSVIAGQTYRLERALAKTDTALYTNLLIKPIDKLRIGTGDGSTATYSGTLNGIPMVSGQLIITDGVETFTPDSGTPTTLNGDAGGTGTINYTTGAYSVTFNTDVVNTTVIYATYQYKLNKGQIAVYKDFNDGDDYEMLEITALTSEITNEDETTGGNYAVRRGIATGGVFYESAGLSCTDDSISNLDLRQAHDKGSFVVVIPNQYNLRRIVKDNTSKDAIASECVVGDIVFVSATGAIWHCKTAGSLEQMTPSADVSSLGKQGAGTTLTGAVKLNEDTTQGLTITEDSGDNALDISISNAAEAQKGVSEIATQTETDTITDDTRIVTPKKAAVNSKTAITTLEGADQFPLADNSDSDKNKKITYANLQTELNGDLLFNKKLTTNITDVTISNDATETTLITETLLGGTLGTDNAVSIKLFFSSVKVKQSNSLAFNLKYGTTTIATLTFTESGSGNADIKGGTIECVLFGATATDAQEGIVCSNFPYYVASLVGGLSVGTGAEDSTGDLTLSVTAKYGAADALNALTCSSGYITIIKS